MYFEKGKKEGEETYIEIRIVNMVNGRERGKSQTQCVDKTRKALLEKRGEKRNSSCKAKNGKKKKKNKVGEGGRLTEDGRNSIHRSFINENYM